MKDDSYKGGWPEEGSKSWQHTVFFHQMEMKKVSFHWVYCKEQEN